MSFCLFAFKDIIQNKIIMSCTSQESKCVKLFRSFFAATSPLNLIIKLQSLLGIMGLNVDTLGWLHIYSGRLGVIVADLCYVSLFEDILLQEWLKV